MGVDYEANFGIGVVLSPLSEQELSEEDAKRFDGDFSAWLEEVLEEAKEVAYFQRGDGWYSGEENTFALCIKDPMKDGAEDLVKKVDLFKEFLVKSKIKYSGDVDLVGGVHAC